MSKKLEAKNSLIEAPIRNKPAVPTAENLPLPARTRTAVGTMAQFVATQSPVHKEAEELRERLKTFDNAKLVRRLPPSSIFPSPWANRHADSFSQSDYIDLKNEIMEAGGNVQPIKVRPLNGSTPSREDKSSYEIVYGHRRHRACLDLNLPVSALIEDVDDQALFEQMERENRGRKNLSAWEQGSMYLTALDRGLYSSQRKLSEALGVDVSLISKSIALARLPDAIVEAFSSPLAIQYRWAQPLGEVLQKDPEGILARAKTLVERKTTPPFAALEVFNHLIGATEPGKSEKLGRSLLRTGRETGRLVANRNGAVTLTLKTGTLTEAQQEQFFKVVETFLNSL